MKIMNEEKPKHSAEEMAIARQEIVNEISKLKNEYSNGDMEGVLDTNIPGQKTNYKFRKVWFTLVSMMCDRLRQLYQQDLIKFSPDSEANLWEKINKVQDEDLLKITTEEKTTKEDVANTTELMNDILAKLRAEN